MAFVLARKEEEKKKENSKQLSQKVQRTHGTSVQASMQSFPFGSLVACLSLIYS